jgi:hypothetical protein
MTPRRSPDGGLDSAIFPWSLAETETAPLLNIMAWSLKADQWFIAPESRGDRFLNKTPIVKLVEEAACYDTSVADVYVLLGASDQYDRRREVLLGRLKCNAKAESRPVWTIRPRFSGDSILGSVPMATASAKEHVVFADTLWSPASDTLVVLRAAATETLVFDSERRKDYLLSGRDLYLSAPRVVVKGDIRVLSFSKAAAPYARPGDPGVSPEGDPGASARNGNTGANGGRGVLGKVGRPGAAGPAITLDVRTWSGTGALHVSANGQDGGMGQDGGPGGTGQKGGTGRNASVGHTFIGNICTCVSDCGDGGNAGMGGQGGDAGPGGRGGNGGSVELRLPVAVASSHGFQLHVDVGPGAPGPCGRPGGPGDQGTAGEFGDRICCASTGRQKGNGSGGPAPVGDLGSGLVCTATPPIASPGTVDCGAAGCQKISFVRIAP